LQTASIPSLSHPFNQTKNWDRPILQTKHVSGIIPTQKSGMVLSHPT
ncbi:Os01g0685100, partial [Oryza sativa Japonica Group]